MQPAARVLQPASRARVLLRARLSGRAQLQAQRQVTRAARVVQTTLVQLWLHVQRWLLDTANSLGEAVKYRLTALRSTVGPCITVDPSAEAQLFEGWGTSLAWFADVLGRSEAHLDGAPVQMRVRVADLLFKAGSPGLGLTICRYNVGGAGWDTPDAGNLRPGANIESFWGPDGTWDWTLDAGQRWMLRAALERGATTLEAFSNSPPYWMTISGRSSGSSGGKTDNLAPDKHGMFVRYLVTVMQHFHKRGIRFRTLAPFNEPDTSYWYSGNKQEGCHFSPASQGAALRKLRAAMSEAGLLADGVGIAAPEETSLDTTLHTLRSLSPAELACIDQINTHTYEGTQREELRRFAATSGKRLWMSEVGNGASPLDQMGGALHLAAGIARDLNLLGCSAWVYWQAVEDSQAGNWWGLLQTDFSHPTSLAVSKQFHAMQQYCFVRPGYRILLSEAPANAVLAKSRVRADGSWTLVAVLTQPGSGFLRSPGPAMTQLDLTRLEPGHAAVQVLRTSAGEDCLLVDTFAVDVPCRLALALPAASITTVVLDLAPSVQSQMEGLQ